MLSEELQAGHTKCTATWISGQDRWCLRSTDTRPQIAAELEARWGAGVW
jgi:hypothetical protein